MDSSWPILASQDLESVARRTLFHRKSRDESQLPKVGTHQVLVYLTGGGLVLDHGQFRVDDDPVVNALHVSLVDTGRAVPVTMLLTIPSAEASDFTVEVMFACTVTDPIRVVRENVDAQTELRHYLLSHRKISDLGLPYRMMQISQVRIDVGAQITAYATLRPPVISGLEVTMTSVQVHQPNEMARGKHLSEQREAAYAHEQLDNLAEAVGNDPYRALLAADINGELAAEEFADAILTDQATRAEHDRGTAEQVRPHEQRAGDLDHGDKNSADRDRFARKIELLKRLSAAGHLDMVNINIDRIIADVIGTPFEEIQAPDPLDLCIAVRQAGERSEDGRATPVVHRLDVNGVAAVRGCRGSVLKWVRVRGPASPVDRTARTSGFDHSDRGCPDLQGRP
jgi:hypothetical protein